MKEFNEYLKAAHKDIEKRNRHLNNVEVICLELIELQTIRESKNELL